MSDSTNNLQKYTVQLRKVEISCNSSLSWEKQQILLAKKLLILGLFINIWGIRK